MSYDVVLLVEQALSELDGRQVRSLHSDVEDGPVRYHVLLPVDDAALRVETAMGALGGEHLLGTPAAPTAPVLTPDEAAEIEQEMLSEGERDVRTSLGVLRGDGFEAEGDVVRGDPIKALTEAVSKVDAREVIVLTRSHVVAEFFHVDWTAKARRHLGVPVLHLIEHETFDEQSGEGEGASLI